MTSPPPSDEFLSEDNASERVIVSIAEPCQPSRTGDESPRVEGIRSHDTLTNTKGFLLLSALHFLSAWGDRTINFAAYLLLLVIFPSTLLPASIYGFCATGSSILFSTVAGSAVDRYDRLALLRSATIIQKVSSGTVYAICLVFFLTSLGNEHFTGRALAAFVAIVISGAITKVSTVCLNICIERDWAGTIGRNSPERLTRLNAWLRRIDLTCDLVAPIFVSSLSTGVGYSVLAALLCCMTIVSLMFEVAVSGYAYRAFPILKSERIFHSEKCATEPPNHSSLIGRTIAFLDPRHLLNDFKEFRTMPVFYRTRTSLSISSAYLTVLSFDGTMLTFLKDARDYSDLFISGQRAVCTVAGIIGTVLFPITSKKLGLVRTCSWSIWLEFISLLPVVVSLYVDERNAEVGARHSVPAWNTAILFGGMAFSRIFLWMFDLAQLQILQESLEGHPRRNRLTSFQYVLQNAFDMIKYALIMALHRPSQFRWAGLVSVLSVFAAGCIYTVGYARRVQGRIVPLQKQTLP